MADFGKSGNLGNWENGKTGKPEIGKMRKTGKLRNLRAGNAQKCARARKSAKNVEKPEKPGKCGPPFFALGKTGFWGDLFQIDFSRQEMGGRAKIGSKNPEIPGGRGKIIRGLYVQNVPPDFPRAKTHNRT